MASKKSAKAKPTSIPATPKTTMLLVPSDAAAVPVKNTVQVHRCRFIEYTPVAITCLAFTADGQGIVVGRADASIEFWLPGGSHNPTTPLDARNWTAVARYPGRLGTSVQCLVWAKGDGGVGRLFVGGLHGKLSEFEFPAFQPKWTRDSHGGAVWCAGVAPSLAGEASDTLAIGCEDGFVRLFDISRGGVEYSRSLGGSEGRILSLAWHPSQRIVYAGSANGSVRGFDLSSVSASASGASGSSSGTVHPFVRITVESLGTTPALVWSLLVLPDLSVVSGDSLGHVQIWDGRMGTLVHSFTAHTADVMGLAALPSSSPSQSSFVSCSLDGKVQGYATVARGGGAVMWGLATNHRGHTHDVRAVVVAAGPVPLIASGGVDSLLCMCTPSSFASGSVHKMLPYTSTIPYVSIAPTARLLLSQQPTSLDLYRVSAGFDAERMAHAHFDKIPAVAGVPGPSARVVKTIAPRDVGLAADASIDYLHLLSLGVKGASSAIVTSAISPNGRYVAYCTIDSLRLFELSDDGTTTTVSRRKLPSLPSGERGIRLAFTTDGSKLFVGLASCSIAVYTLSSRSGHALVAVFNAINGKVSMPGSHSDDDATASDDDDGDDDEPQAAQHNKKRKPGAAAVTAMPAKAGGKALKKAKGDAVLTVTSTATACSTAPLTLAAMVVSNDGALLAVAATGTFPVVQLFDVARLKLQATCARPSAPVTALAFNPDASTLAVVCNNNNFTLHDTASGALTEWSRTYEHSFPSDYLAKAVTDAVIHASFNPAAPDTLILSGRLYLCHVNTALPPRPSLSFERTRKRRAAAAAAAAAAAGAGGEADSDDTSASEDDEPKQGAKPAVKAAGVAAAPATSTFKFVDGFGPMLASQYLAGNEYLVAEMPWLHAAKRLPDPVFRARFGR